MSLAKHLARKPTCVAQFTLLLEDEARLLAAGKVDGSQLSELAARKQVLLGDIAQMESQRQYAQSRLGHGDDRKGAERAAADAGHFGCSTVAGGVEKEEQAQMLREMGCQLAQRDWYSPPLKVEQFVEFCVQRQPEMA